MTIDDSDLRKLPIVPALAFAARCANLARPSFENRWDDFYEDAVDCAVIASMEIAAAPKGTSVLAPEGYADYCTDLQGFAANENLTVISLAANSAAGAAYAASIVADIYNGHRAKLPGHFYTNVKRAVDAAYTIEGLDVKIQSEFLNLIEQVNHEELTDYSPIDKSQMESGFTYSKSDSQRSVGLKPIKLYDTSWQRCYCPTTISTRPDSNNSCGWVIFCVGHRDYYVRRFLKDGILISRSSKIIGILGCVVLIVGLLYAFSTRSESYFKDPYGTGPRQYNDTYYRFRDFDSFYRVITRRENGEIVYRAEGQMRDRKNPKRHGRWIIRVADDRFEEGFYKSEIWYWHGERDASQRARRE